MPTNRASELESKYYPAVAAWLKGAKGCFEADTNTGLRWARIDAVGLRDTGGSLSGGTEVVAIEVKRDGAPFGNSLGQAHSYSVYADRCYLAFHRTSTTPPSDAAIEMAAALGVGLIELRGRSRRPEITEVLGAPVGRPLEHLRLEVMEKLGYSICSLCRSAFRRGEKGAFRRNVRTTVPRAIADEKGLIYWLHEVAGRQGSAKRLDADEDAKPESIYQRRYLCPDCVWALFKDID